ncbi:MAG: 16S rRNA (cytidine(1402)-2'-O)-methyltransferase [Desulfobacterales bacterium C00003106]|jgi:16S rRNA (cytidine1402-2'-O)-methyltransferase|nr:MAG: 16S rRNA (cytidine(1402)-2'-O)-methyltransferase [Desulfobacterales bacterium C00003106]OEU58520.1 MAG: 16S rRNA (cytidine(1402)-2'-O)-methyltransferase [Desulfobacterales bacterium C00003104]
MPLNLLTNGKKQGRLFVVATPIGNLEDITLRALRILREVDLIAAEDTRHTRKLLSHYAISTRLVSYHDHNKESRAPELIEKLKGNWDIALVTDAGTPAISDPGYFLIGKAKEGGIRVVSVPGACAAVAALSISGLPSDRFLFVGFLARKKKKRTEVLQGLKSKGMTLIFYESPHRLLRTLADLVSVVGDRSAVVARELTKYHEEVIRGSLSEILATLSDRDRIRGECTLLVEGRKEKEFKSDELVVDELERLAKEGSVSVKDAVRTVAGKHGISRGRVYREALRLWAS